VFKNKIKFKKIVSVLERAGYSSEKIHKKSSIKSSFSGKKFY